MMKQINDHEVDHVVGGDCKCIRPNPDGKTMQSLPMHGDPENIMEACMFACCKRRTDFPGFVFNGNKIACP
jgi:hypothetical protein